MTNSDYRILIGLVVLCLVSYCRTLDAPFVFDDFDCIGNNSLIRDFGNYFSHQKAIQTYNSNPQMLKDTLNNFITRPLSYFTFSINYAIHGNNVTGYHIVNTFIHTLNTLFVYLLVQITILIQIERNPLNSLVMTSMKSRGLAFLTASFFAVHPLMTNAVTYMTQRMTSLVTLFYLASILLYACSTNSRSKSIKITLYPLAILSCCAAMLTKEIAFTLPLMLLLYDMVFCTDMLRNRLLRIMPFLLTMTIIPYHVIGVAATRTSPAHEIFSSSINLVNFNQISSWEYLLTQFRVVAFYYKLLLLPLDLSLEHDVQISHSITEPGVLLGIMLHLSLIGYGSYILWRSRTADKPTIIEKLTGFGIIWFYIALSVESSIIPLSEIAVEYRTYLPSAGIFLFAVCSGYRLLAHLPITGGGMSALYIICIPVLCILMYLTIMRNEVWKQPDILWKQTISLYPKLIRPYANLADYYINRGELETAVEVYQTSLLKIPYEPVLHYELGIVYILKRDYEFAILELGKAIALKPDMIKAYDRLTQAYVFSGKYDQAYSILDKINQLKRDRP